MKVNVVQDEDGKILAVLSDDQHLCIGRSRGIKTTEFVLDNLHKVGKDARPWSIYFMRADEDRPHIWPITGFPKESGPNVLSEGIEYVVYAIDASKALERVFDSFDFDWDVAVNDWKKMQ